MELAPGEVGRRCSSGAISSPHRKSSRHFLLVHPGEPFRAAPLSLAELTFL